MPKRTAAASDDVVRRAGVAVALALTASTGVVDAVGYLGLDRVFTGNMTGNVVLLGMGLAGAASLPVLLPLLALGAFVVGAAAGGLVQRRAAAGWSSSTTVLLSLVALGEALLAVLLLVEVGGPEGGTTGDEPVATGLLAQGTTAALGAVMGLQAATARRLAVADLPTVVVTSTLTGLASDVWKGLGTPWPRRIGAVVLISAGAGVGALLLRWHAGAALLVSTVLTLGAVVVGHVLLHPRGRGARQRGERTAAAAR